FLLINVRRKLAWYNGPLFFTIPSQQQSESQLEIANVPAGATMWGISDPFACTERDITISGDVARVNVPTQAQRSFALFQTSSLEAATFEENVENQDLRIENTPDLVIVVHPDFEAEAERLASHRRNTYGLDVTVVTTIEVYNEFSAGRQDITAIRDFMRYL